MYKTARIAFKTLLKRILWFIDVCFFYMHVYTCARKQKKETEKKLQRALPISFLFQKKRQKKSLQRALFSLDAVFFFCERQKKEGAYRSPSVPSFFVFKFLNFQNL